VAAKKRRKRKWPLILLTLALLGVLVPLTFWIGLNWFVGTVVEAPEKKKKPAAATEKISKEERDQLERIIKKHQP
jgi:hypothetical protein